tara:strand:+ start:590 stop:1219 length:630 start_codon:yes stop_codon:yes gene_type:complete
MWLWNIIYIKKIIYFVLIMSSEEKKSEDYRSTENPVEELVRRNILYLSEQIPDLENIYAEIGFTRRRMREIENELESRQAEAEYNRLDAALGRLTFDEQETLERERDRINNRLDIAEELAAAAAARDAQERNELLYNLEQINARLQARSYPLSEVPIEIFRNNNDDTTTTGGRRRTQTARRVKKNKKSKKRSKKNSKGKSKRILKLGNK